MGSVILQAKGIVKDFPGTRALDEVDFSISTGEVHCLVGENGAGKSTLIKVLSGAYRKSSGTILVDGRERAMSSPHEARACGISTIYQEPALIPPLTVAENIFLGAERLSGMGLVNWRKTRQEAERILDRLGVRIDVGSVVADLSVAARQLVAIAKALALNSRVLIMDEPSAILTGRDLEQLFSIIKNLKADGVGIIYISHNLSEVFELGDRLTVLRDGRVVATAAPRDVTVDQVIEWMVGRPVRNWLRRDKAEVGDTVLEVRHLTRRGEFSEVSFRLRRGEVLGLAGLTGSGRSELVRCIIGATQPTSGEVLLDGRRFRPRSPKEALTAGISFVPEDRKRDGLLPCRPVYENIVLSVLRRLARILFVRGGAALRVARTFCLDLSVKASSLSAKVRDLSGGNQQKVVLARCLATNPRIMILDEPTRGVDVPTKAEIYSLLGRLTRSGVACLMVSSELPEVLALSDRILVMSEGRITAELTAADTSQEEILRHAMPSDSRIVGGG